MVTIFNRKKLLVESSGQEIARINDLLKEKGIEFLNVTKRNSSGNFKKTIIKWCDDLLNYCLFDVLIL